MKSFILLALTLLSVQASLATHLRGGYIQAKAISGSTTSYEVTVTVYLDEVSGRAAADQAQLISVCFGDGTSSNVTRVARVRTGDNTLSVNTYQIVHTYAGPGNYVLSTSIQNRTTARNITRADQLPLLLTTSISTNTQTPNTTPTLAFPQNGFRLSVNQPATIAFSATDAEGDSLVYALATPSTSNKSDQCLREPVDSYSFPNDVTRRGTFKLNGRTGNLVWNAPTEEGTYSIAVTVSEYRRGILISQTVEEISVLVVDQPGTPAVIPGYEPAVVEAVVTAIREYATEDVTLTVFPNPVDDRLQVVVQTATASPATLQLMDATGRLVHELAFTKASRQHEQVISMGSLAPGQYILRTEVSGRSLVRKVVKR
ncbi:T9SS type A sorting domain-containing protein [Spirosoma fluminis]